MKDPCVGMVVDERFRIDAELGTGGFSEVWRATDLQERKPVALKVLDARVSRDDDLMERFLREARLLFNLDHPQSVRVVALGVINRNRPYLAMELVKGKPLSDVLDQEGPMPLTRLVPLLRSIAGVIDAAHGNNIIHRDIKPANVIINHREGIGDSIKVIDFGIAGCLDIDRLGQQESGPIGTPAYMSPEAFEGRKADHRTDIYSLGVMVFELLTGKVPYSGQSQLELALMHQENPIPSLRLVAPDLEIPEDLQLIINRAMAKNYRDRFDSAVEFAQQFAQTVAHGDPSLAYLASLADPTLSALEEDMLLADVVPRAKYEEMEAELQKYKSDYLKLQKRVEREGEAYERELQSLQAKNAIHEPGVSPAEPPAELLSYYHKLAEFNQELEDTERTLALREMNLNELTMELELKYSKLRANVARQQSSIHHLQKELRRELEFVERQVAIRDQISKMKTLRGGAAPVASGSDDETVAMSQATHKLQNLSNKIRQLFDEPANEER